MSLIPASFGWNGANALPLTFPFTFGLQLGDAELHITVTAPAAVQFASANGIAALPVTPASTASATRIAWGDGGVSVVAVQGILAMELRPITTATFPTCGS